MAKGKGGRRRGLPKTVGGWVSLVFHILGGAVAAGPAISVVQAHISDGAWANTPKDLMYAYTGIGDDGQFHLEQTTKAVASVGGGVLIAKVGSFLGRMIR